MIKEGIAYIEGVKFGLYAFAWWIDGTQYVGTCGTTLKEALELAEREQLFGQRHSLTTSPDH